MLYPQYKKLNLIEIYNEILSFFEKEKIFEKTLKQRENNESFVFYECPPSANGLPGIHHVIGRTFKDFVCRYQTLKGKYVQIILNWKILKYLQKI